MKLRYKFNLVFWLLKFVHRIVITVAVYKAHLKYWKCTCSDDGGENNFEAMFKCWQEHDEKAMAKPQPSLLAKKD